MIPGDRPAAAAARLFASLALFRCSSRFLEDFVLFELVFFLGRVLLFGSISSTGRAAASIARSSTVGPSSMGAFTVTPEFSILLVGSAKTSIPVASGASCAWASAALTRI